MTFCSFKETKQVIKSVAGKAEESRGLVGGYLMVKYKQ